MTKTVLITGCSSGIGHALALEFKAKGLRVFATARKASSLADLEARGIEPLSLEVTSIDSIKALKDEVASRTGGGLDYLVNNAGRNYTVPALDVDIDEVRSVFETNVFAVMRMCQTFAPLLIAAKGTIVQIDSLAGIMPYVFGSVYGASKAALHSYSDTLRVELAPFDVRVVNVITGGVKSDLGRIERVLPRDSICLPIEEDYARRQKYTSAQAITAEDYAHAVVPQVLNMTAKDTLWEGGMAWVVWFLTFFPRRVLDWHFSRTFKLWKLKGSDTKKLR
ncbi:hypothetical protein BAUCODRAFT_124075 [Baudoinia panamericana UAMH 10762]|uniref:Uncharacterized protein n=1 Tax=Baudoinia panamericana (strain UAMH 10762) TaxID=717646 RepID=M2N6P7_BAUPA|nr:uncharacterized protein BAUCODRAFT_124075 [Baudoinia panamericana UAMH 10762]EMC94450.1 hypothetical protein BAUCODRAFT_124075 [Baudoinia panamericana UAMH 10762]